MISSELKGNSLRTNCGDKDKTQRSGSLISVESLPLSMVKHAGVISLGWKVGAGFLNTGSSATRLRIA